jgi:hypothetical protein
MLNILIYDLSNKFLLIQGGIIVLVHWSIKEYQMLEYFANSILPNFKVCIPQVEFSYLPISHC